MFFVSSKQRPVFFLFTKGTSCIPTYLSNTSPSSISSQSKDGITPDMQAIAARPCAEAQIFKSSIS